MAVCAIAVWRSTDYFNDKITITKTGDRILPRAFNDPFASLGHNKKQMRINDISCNCGDTVHSDLMEDIVHFSCRNKHDP